MTDISDQTIQTFLDDLASKSATPGGGSAAALMGAQAAALVSMVCNLTIGKPKFTEVETEMQAVLNQAEALRKQLTGLIQQDIDVFNRLMAKYAMPKDSDDEKAARSEAIQTILKEATDVPLQCATACKEVINLAKIVTEKGNPNVISDAGAALMAAYGALKISVLNVVINAGSLKDQSFVDSKLAELSTLTTGLEQDVEQLYTNIKTKL